jgi:nicotinamidase/pyrazinamidase
LVSRRIIFWDVDTQVDFMLPGGKLYVPGAEKLIPNLDRLTDQVRKDRVFLVSDACIHAPDDPEFQRFPPHCVRGTRGAEMIPGTVAERVLILPNRRTATVPGDLSPYQQVILEKQTLDVFDNPLTEIVLERLKQFTDADAEFMVFGVVTEYCVRCVAKGLRERGRQVSLVEDAIKTLKTEDGESALAEMKSVGARMITTRDAINSLSASISKAGMTPDYVG